MDCQYDGYLYEYGLRGVGGQVYLGWSLGETPIGDGGQDRGRE